MTLPSPQPPPAREEKLPLGWQKWDVAGKWFSGAVTGTALFVLTYCFNQSSQRIARTQQNATLVAQLIASLADTSGARKDLALIALDYAVPTPSGALGDTVDLVARVSERLVRTDTVIAHGRFALTVLRKRAPASAAAIAREYSPKSPTVAELPAEHRVAGDTTPRTAAAIPPAVRNVARGVVYIQFDGRGPTEIRDRALMNRLRAALAGRGYAAPGVDSVSGGADNTVRYFNDLDRDGADSVASIVAQTLRVMRPRVRRAPYRGSQGLLEVWLDLRSVPDSALAPPRA